jgi:hypothetical protein
VREPVGYGPALLRRIPRGSSLLHGLRVVLPASDPCQRAQRSVKYRAAEALVSSPVGCLVRRSPQGPFVRWVYWHCAGAMQFPRRTVRSDLPDWVAMMLRTTRGRLFDDAKILWAQRNRTGDGKNYQRVPAKHQNTLAARLEPTTIFNFLYRMRTRSNYHDANAFLVGIDAGDDALLFNAGIINVLRATLFVFECAIAQSVGRPTFERFASSFARDVGTMAEQTVARRLACQ